MKTKIAALLALTGALAISEPTQHAPVLVELFTSEGCSDCPPADALLARLDASNQQIIVLSEHVDYFNQLGWKDPYSSAAFTDRQSAYAEQFKLSSVYTPEMVVNGTTEFVGSDNRAAKAKITEASSRPTTVPVKLTINAGTVRVEIDAAPAGQKIGPADVMFALAANEKSTQVLRGENSGKSLHHVAVVRSLTKIGELKEGKPFSKEIQTGRNTNDLRVVAWLQKPGQGPVLGVAMKTLAAGL
jgi:hypothetical protein